MTGNGAHSNGGPPAEPTFDLDAMLAAISDRLITTDVLSVGNARPSMIEPVEMTRIMIFELDDTPFAFELDNISEVIQKPVVTSVPGMPGWVLGVINVQGEIVSVVDLPYFLGLRDWPTRPDQVNTLLITSAGDLQIGLTVDAVRIIYTAPAEHIISPPFAVGTELATYLRGAIERDGAYIRLLDCERLLTGQEIQQF